MHAIVPLEFGWETNIAPAARLAGLEVDLEVTVPFRDTNHQAC